MYTLIVFCFLSFLIFTLLYPYIYLKPLTVINVTSDSARLQSISYRTLKKLHRYRCGDFVCFSSDDLSSILKYDSVVIDKSFYVCFVGRFGRLISVDPTSQTLNSFLRRFSK